jgi:outer membrane protein
MKKFLLTALLGCLLSASAWAQDLKIGYVNVDSVISVLPETKVQQRNMESYAKQLQAQLELKQKEMQTTYQGFVQKVQAGGVPPAEQQKMEEQLQKMQAELQVAQQKAQADLAKKENDLITPLYQKVTEAIKAYAKANGFNYIMSEELLVYALDTQDLTGQIIEKLTKQ